jgi:hypothetical protein
LEKRDTPLLGTERLDGFDMVPGKTKKRKDVKRSRPWGIVEIVQIPRLSCLSLR